MANKSYRGRPRDPNQLGKLVVNISTTVKELGASCSMGDYAESGVRDGHPGGPGIGRRMLSKPRSAAVRRAADMRGKRSEGGRRAQIMRRLLEGDDLRTVERSTNVSRAQVQGLFVSAANAFAELQDLAFRDLRCKLLRIDAVWTCAPAKGKRVSANEVTLADDVWTWVAVDGDTRLVPSWLIGDRTPETAFDFANDLAGRMASGVRLTAEGHQVRLEAVDGPTGGVAGYETLVRMYGPVPGDNGRYGQTERDDVHALHIEQSVKAHLNISPAARKNLAKGMRIRPFAWATKGCSRRIVDHALSIAVHYMHYNFCRVHEALGCTPAMSAGVTGRLWDHHDLMQVLENWEDTKGTRDESLTGR